MQNSKCKICRRLGVKLFLKGERCLSPKCALVKKPYPPGMKRKGRPRPLSEFAKELREKQKLRNWYNLKERPFRKYVKEILERRRRIEDPALALIKTLERRLDNVVFRLGLAPSRLKARQLIGHRHFLVNGRVVNIPSYQVKKGDLISVKPASAKKPVFQNLTTVLKKYKSPSWLELNVEKLTGKIIGEPKIEEALPPVEISSIFEFYSR